MIVKDVYLDECIVNKTMTNEEMLKIDLERAVKELELDGSNTKQRVRYLLEECLEVYFKPKKYLTYDDLKVLESDKYYKVKMNDTDYEMVLDKKDRISIGVCLMLDDNDVMKVYLDDYYTDKQFFNDLHLELVEE